METSRVYTINKGINRPITFRGIKAQYIGYLGATVVGGLVVFAILYISGVSSYIDVPFTLGLCGFLIVRVYRMSQKYGQYGLMKRKARREVPEALLSRSRKIFIQLFSDYAKTTR